MLLICRQCRRPQGCPKTGVLGLALRWESWGNSMQILAGRVCQRGAPVTLCRPPAELNEGAHLIPAAVLAGQRNRIIQQPKQPEPGELRGSPALVVTPQHVLVSASPDCTSSIPHEPNISKRGLVHQGLR